MVGGFLSFIFTSTLQQLQRQFPREAAAVHLRGNSEQLTSDSWRAGGSLSVSPHATGALTTRLDCVAASASACARHGECILVIDNTCSSHPPQVSTSLVVVRLSRAEDSCLESVDLSSRLNVANMKHILKLNTNYVDDLS